MQRRIQINENIELRELGAGQFGLFSADKKEFLQQGGKPIALQQDDILVLPKNHSALKLDLNPRTASGEIAARNHLLFVENHGDSIEVAGNNLAVIGRAHVKVSAYDLAGIDEAALKDGKVKATSHAGNMDDLMNAGVRGLGNLKGRVMSYGNGQHIVALDMPPNGQHNRIDFVDKSSEEKLLTIVGDTNGEDRKVAASRVTAMQNAILPKVANALNEQNAVQLSLLGAPESLATAKRDYAAAPRQADPSGKNYPAVKEEETPKEKESRESFLRQFREAPRVIPDGREKISHAESPAHEAGVAPDQVARVAAPAPTQAELDEAQSHNVLGLPNHAMTAAIAERNRAQARIESGNHDSINSPASIPLQTGGDKGRPV